MHSHHHDLLQTDTLADSHHRGSLHIHAHEHDEKIRQLYKVHPEYKTRDSIDRLHFEEEYAQYLSTYDPYARSTYIVPVVVHVVHSGGEENISDDQIFDAIEHLNEDFNMNNDDLLNTLSPFNTVTGNTGIEFRIAKKDPNQNPHSGITRTLSDYAAMENTGDDDRVISDIIQQHGRWPDDRYMNIIISEKLFQMAGFSYTPRNHFSGMIAGVFMRHDFVGAIGTSSKVKRHALTHEVGHWFGLLHCWGEGNLPGQENGCESDDGVADTPRTIGWTTCELGNTCSNDAVDGFWTTDVADNVQNFMSYSFCSTMFTRGQVARIQTALNSSIAGRNNLSKTDNLVATGTDVPSSLPVEQQQRQHLAVYPNPAHRSVVIQLNGKAGQEVALHLFSTTGQRVAVIYEDVVHQDGLTVEYPVEELENGTYFIKVIAEDVVQTVKWVKAPM